MNQEEFKKYVELIASMSIDFMTMGKLTKETYLANLKVIVFILDGEAEQEEGKGKK